MSQEQKKDMSQNFYRASAADFMKIPGSPIAYSASIEVINLFLNGVLSDYADTRLGMATADNNRFLRFWHEVGQDRVNFAANDRADAVSSEKRWFPYQKGGDFRKWYGNMEYCVNWENDGSEIQNFKDENSGKIRSHNYNLEYIFRRGVTWNALTSGKTSARLSENSIFDNAGSSLFVRNGISEEIVMGLINSKVMAEVFPLISPTLNYQPGDLSKLPAYFPNSLQVALGSVIVSNIKIAKIDWNTYEPSWGFTSQPLQNNYDQIDGLKQAYRNLRLQWQNMTQDARYLEVEINRLFIDAYDLQDTLIPEVPVEEVTLTCNPYYRYGGNRSEEELETLLQCDTLRELVSYSVGCMMGRYSLDKPGLILACQGETIQSYLTQIPAPRLTPDEDAILPITDQEWFAEDVSNRVHEFIRVAWGDKYLQENLDFVAESLCLHAIKPKISESSLETVRRYLSTQFFKDHLRTYKKRPIYWLFSSGKHKAFECLVYMHRYNEGTLSRMRMEYVVPLQSRFQARIEDLDNSLSGDLSTSERKRLQKELDLMRKKLDELRRFDEKLRHYADQRIQLDLDDGVKVNYGKFGDLLADVKAITGN